MREFVVIKSCNFCGIRFEFCIVCVVALLSGLLVALVDHLVPTVDSQSIFVKTFGGCAMHPKVMVRLGRPVCSRSGPYKQFGHSESCSEPLPIARR